jgi:hypothetical protein
MSYLPPADRAFDVMEPIVIYRLVGRRPSQVYVDEAMRPASAGAPGSRLSDGVYWQTKAKVGDQIQERPGTTLLVTAEGEACPILLTEPTPLTIASAFVHAQNAAQIDREKAAALKAQGALREALPHRVRSEQSRQPAHHFPEQHPLVVDHPPAPSGPAAAPRPGRSGRWGRAR